MPRSPASINASLPSDVTDHILLWNPQWRSFIFIFIFYNLVVWVTPAMSPPPKLAIHTSMATGRPRLSGRIGALAEPQQYNSSSKIRIWCHIAWSALPDQNILAVAMNAHCHQLFSAFYCHRWNVLSQWQFVVLDHLPGAPSACWWPW